MKLILSTVALFALFNVITGLAINKSPTKQLNDGNHMPTIALGTFGFEDIPKVRQAVKWGIEAGYRYIDTAGLHKYEEEIGKGISDVLKKGLIKREDLFVTAKLWIGRHAQDQVVPALRESLAKLGLEYVDLYLIYSPTEEDGSPLDIDYLETWEGMEEAQKLGLAKSIGLSNFKGEQIDRIIEKSKVVPAVNQIENTRGGNPGVLRAQHPVMAYNPFAFFVSRDGTGPSRDAKISNKNVKPVLLRCLPDRVLIAIPKSTNQDRIKENIDVFDFQLTPNEIATTNSFNTNTSIFDFNL